MIAPGALLPYIGNARTHPEWQVAQIAASITEFGFCNPVLIAGDNSVIAGHGRLLAAQRLQIDKVPCVRLDHLSDAQRRALIIADNKIANDNMGSGEFRRFLVSAFGAAWQVLRAGAPIYVAHADIEGLNFRKAFVEAGFKLSGCLVWVKPSLVLGRSDYQWRHEPILYGWKPGAAHTWLGGRANTTVVEHDGAAVRAMPDGTIQIDLGDRVIVVEGKEMSMRALDSSIVRFDKPKKNGEHPTMKPVGLIRRFLENSAPPGSVVLDLFGGSGSTLIACEVMGREARLIELEPKFCDVIVMRWQEMTGRRAILEADGREFDAIRAEQMRGAA